jgi:hypothetical protein
LLLLYFWFSAAVWGDPLFRRAGIESIAGQHLRAWSDTPPGLLDRLVLQPARQLVVGFGPVVALAAFSAGLAFRERSFWAFCSLSMALLALYGSASLSSYEPLPVTPRMMLSALPGLCILAGHVVAGLGTSAEGRPAGRLQLAPLVVLALASLSFLGYVGTWIGERAPERSAMDILRQEVAANPQRDYLMITSDERSPEFLAVYFGYEYPPNLRVQSVRGVVDGGAAHFDSLFFFVHRERSEFLENAYGGRHYDDRMRQLSRGALFESRGVHLLRGGSLDTLLRGWPGSPEAPEPEAMGPARLSR